MSENNEIISLSHKIEIIANNKQKTHFRKAFGCSRLAYNWGLAKWQEYYKQGIKKSHLDLKKEFNAIKKSEFPFVYEVSKYATQQPFLNLNLAFQKFFRDLKQGKLSYPRFKRKRDNFGSYYIGGDQVALSESNKNSDKYKRLHSNVKAQYLKVPNLGYVKLAEKVRFDGKINSVTISQQGNKFYASFSVSIPQSQFKSQPRSDLGLGIDLGIKSMVSLSNGLEVKSPKPLAKLTRKLVRLSRQLSKKQHPKTKGDKTTKSNNYKKASLKVSKLHKRITYIRTDFLHKLTSSLIKNVGYFCLEDLNVSGMLKNRKLAKSVADVSFYEFRRQLEYKANYHHRWIEYVDRWYPSSKKCSQCGEIKLDLTLSDRIYKCEHCYAVLDRDYNAALNLFHYLKEKIGQVLPEFTPADLTALQADLAVNQLATSKVETGIQQKSYL
ncbi:transposase [Glaesserella parasuis]|uniref:RNA-guided endonuclease InsQ/TnpB family protein n=1 Tax=Glaesserella parasuis TaxID=738 RepID=UPI000AB4CD90|nr:RNA-guided endonuclease TnpB family protein [Glaesserella parasuis]MDG6307664.1 transposase [Glaesserella parasuis]MDG6344844.1 transposase [Glaesserella parasuis]MDG6770737.1 transposase [Glaesserella parasuis]MDO9873397.1 transposase [Glaesserella parasuis]MDO9912344.1 transposase [Glaesserella parasuis]